TLGRATLLRVQPRGTLEGADLSAPPTATDEARSPGRCPGASFAGASGDLRAPWVKASRPPGPGGCPRRSVLRPKRGSYNSCYTTSPSRDLVQGSWERRGPEPPIGRTAILGK